MKENFDPDEMEKEKEENQNGDACNVAGDLLSGIAVSENENTITDNAENISATDEVAENVAETAEEIEMMSIQDVSADILDGAEDVAGNIVDDIFDMFFD